MDEPRLTDLMESNTPWEDVCFWSTCEDGYLVFLDVDARFSMEDFNTVETIGSLLPHLVEPLDSNSDTLESNSIKWTTVRWPSSTPDSARWTLVVWSQAPLSQLDFRTGSQLWTTPLDGLDWRANTLWNYSYAGLRLQLILNEPRWVELSSARVLPSDIDGQFVLEIDFYNHTPRAHRLDEIVILVRRHYLCRACVTMPGPPPPPTPLLSVQDFVLDWELSISNNNGTVDAWTTVVDRRTPAAARFLDPDRLEVRIPTTVTVPPQQLQRHFVRVEALGLELGNDPSTTDAFRRYLEERIPIGERENPETGAIEVVYLFPTLIRDDYVWDMEIGIAEGQERGVFPPQLRLFRTPAMW